MAFSFIDTGVPHGVVECSQLDFTDPKKVLGLPTLELPTLEFPALELPTLELPIVSSSKKTLKGKKNLSLKNDQKQKLLKPLALKLRTKNINNYSEGMNVSFYQVLSKNKLKAITFERGVEDWTLACGTGALAVSLVYLSKETQGEAQQIQVKKSQQENLRIEMPGGSLKVEKGDRLKLFSEVKKSF